MAETTPHKGLTGLDIHTIVRWVVADVASLPTNVTAEDVHKVAYVTDTKTYYGLVAHSPVARRAFGHADNPVVSVTEAEGVLTITQRDGTESTITLPSGGGAATNNGPSPLQRVTSWGEEFLLSPGGTDNRILYGEPTNTTDARLLDMSGSTSVSLPNLVSVTIVKLQLKFRLLPFPEATLPPYISDINDYVDIDLGQLLGVERDPLTEFGFPVKEPNIAITEEGYMRFIAGNYQDDPSTNAHILWAAYLPVNWATSVEIAACRLYLETEGVTPQDYIAVFNTGGGHTPRLLGPDMGPSGPVNVQGSPFSPSVTPEGQILLETSFPSAFEEGGAA